MLPQKLKPLKVLYIEDEVLIALDGEQILRSLGFEDITVAMSFHAGEKAIDNQKFDLALLDINLGGGKTSLTLADRLMGDGVRVLFLSGYSMSDGLRERLKAPSVGKPFDEVVLGDAIQAVLEA